MGSLISGENAVVALLVVGLPLYNFFANRWPPFNALWYVPLNLSLLLLVLVLGFGPLDLTQKEVMGSGGAGAVAVGMLLGLAVGLVLFLVGATGRGRRLLIDERVAHLSDRELVYQVLVRIPLGTALVEEAVFRGVLFAVWQGSGTVAAAVASSAVFGLWHVGPTINLVAANDPQASRTKFLKAVLGAVGFTTLAGLFFVWLRLRIGLAGPIALHATVNGVATIASVLAYRRDLAITRRG